MLKTDKIQTLNIYSASVHSVLYIFPLPGCFFPISLDNNIVDLKKKINPDSVKYQNLSTVPTFLIALIRGRTKGYEGYKVFFFLSCVYFNLGACKNPTRALQKTAPTNSEKECSSVPNTFHEYKEDNVWENTLHHILQCTNTYYFINYSINLI